MQQKEKKKVDEEKENERRKIGGYGNPFCSVAKKLLWEIKTELIILDWVINYQLVLGTGDRRKGTTFTREYIVWQNVEERRVRFCKFEV